jgi:hypothetical protein
MPLVLQITVYPAGRDQFRAMVGGRVVAVWSNHSKRRQRFCYPKTLTQLRR